MALLYQVTIRSSFDPAGVKAGTAQAGAYFDAMVAHARQANTQMEQIAREGARRQATAAAEEASRIQQAFSVKQSAAGYHDPFTGRVISQSAAQQYEKDFAAYRAAKQKQKEVDTAYAQDALAQHLKVSRDIELAESQQSVQRIAAKKAEAAAVRQLEAEGEALVAKRAARETKLAEQDLQRAATIMKVKGSQAKQLAVYEQALSEEQTRLRTAAAKRAEQAASGLPGLGGGGPRNAAQQALDEARRRENEAILAATNARVTTERNAAKVVVGEAEKVTMARVASSAKATKALGADLEAWLAKTKDVAPKGLAVWEQLLTRSGFVARTLGRELGGQPGMMAISLTQLGIGYRSVAIAAENAAAKQSLLNAAYTSFTKNIAKSGPAGVASVLQSVQLATGQKPRLTSDIVSELGAPQQQFASLVQGLRQVKDEELRGALALQVFGADAEKLAPILTTDAAAAAAASTGFLGLSGTAIVVGGAIAAVLASLLILGVTFAKVTEFVITGASQFGKYGDDLYKLRTRTGVATEALSGLVVVAKEVGVQPELLGRAFARLQVNIEKGLINPTGEAGRSLRTLGLNLDALKKMTPTEQVSAVAIGIENLHNQNVKAYASAALLGRGFQQLAPLLKELGGNLEGASALAAKYNLEFSDERIEKAHDYEIAQRNLGLAWAGFEQTVGEEAVPALTRAFTRLADVLAENADSWRSLGQTIGNVIDKMRQAAAFAEAYITHSGGLLSPPGSPGAGFDIFGLIAGKRAYSAEGALIGQEKTQQEYLSGQEQAIRLQIKSAQNAEKVRQALTQEMIDLRAKAKAQRLQTDLQGVPIERSDPQINAMATRLQALQRVLGGAGFGSREELAPGKEPHAHKTPMDRLIDQVTRAEFALHSLYAEGSKEFQLRVRLEDAERTRNDLEQIIKLRHQLGVSLTEALPVGIDAIHEELRLRTKQGEIVKAVTDAQYAQSDAEYKLAELMLTRSIPLIDVETRTQTKYLTVLRERQNAELELTSDLQSAIQLRRTALEAEQKTLRDTRQVYMQMQLDAVNASEATRLNALKTQLQLAINTGAETSVRMQIEAGLQNAQTHNEQPVVLISRNVATIVEQLNAILAKTSPKGSIPGVAGAGTGVRSTTDFLTSNSFSADTLRFGVSYGQALSADVNAQIAIAQRAGGSFSPSYVPGNRLGTSFYGLEGNRRLFLDRGTGPMFGSLGGDGGQDVLRTTTSAASISVSSTEAQNRLGQAYDDRKKEANDLITSVLALNAADKAYNSTVGLSIEQLRDLQPAMANDNELQNEQIRLRDMTIEQLRVEQAVRNDNDARRRASESGATAAGLAEQRLGLLRAQGAQKTVESERFVKGVVDDAANARVVQAEKTRETLAADEDYLYKLQVGDEQSLQMLREGAAASRRSNEIQLQQEIVTLEDQIAHAGEDAAARRRVAYLSAIHDIQDADVKASESIITSQVKLGDAMTLHSEQVRASVLDHLASEQTVTQAWANGMIAAYDKVVGFLDRGIQKLTHGIPIITELLTTLEHQLVSRVFQRFLDIFFPSTTGTATSQVAPSRGFGGILSGVLGLGGVFSAGPGGTPTFSGGGSGIGGSSINRFVSNLFGGLGGGGIAVPASSTAGLLSTSLAGATPYLPLRGGGTLTDKSFAGALGLGGNAFSLSGLAGILPLAGAGLGASLGGPSLLGQGLGALGGGIGGLLGLAALGNPVTGALSTLVAGAAGFAAILGPLAAAAIVAAIIAKRNAVRRKNETDRAQLGTDTYSQIISVLNNARDGQYNSASEALADFDKIKSAYFAHIATYDSKTKRIATETWNDPKNGYEVYRSLISQAATDAQSAKEFSAKFVPTYAQGGYVPFMGAAQTLIKVRPGERIDDVGRHVSWVVPGVDRGYDSVYTTASPGSAVRTQSQQSIPGFANGSPSPPSPRIVVIVALSPEHAEELGRTIPGAVIANSLEEHVVTTGGGSLVGHLVNAASKRY